MKGTGTILLVALIALVGVPLAGEENASNVPAGNAVSGPIASTSWTGGMSYTYDAAGNVTKVGNDGHVYDRVDRLVSDTVSGIERRHAFDAFGNRTSCADISSGGDCQVVTIASGTNRINGGTYDAAGNLKAYGGGTYTYDVTGMMIRDTAVPGGREYAYTASGERIAVIESNTGTWNWTLRDFSNKVLREMSSTANKNGSHTNWTWTKDNIWRDSQLLSSVQRTGTTTSTSHYHLDHLGTPPVWSATRAGRSSGFTTTRPSARRRAATSRSRPNRASNSPATSGTLSADRRNRSITCTLDTTTPAGAASSLWIQSSIDAT